MSHSLLGNVDGPYNARQFAAAAVYAGYRVANWEARPALEELAAEFGVSVDDLREGVRELVTG